MKQSKTENKTSIQVGKDKLFTSKSAYPDEKITSLIDQHNRSTTKQLTRKKETTCRRKQRQNKKPRGYR